MSFPADISGETVQMTVSGVDSDVSYVFSVRAENRFGSSTYSGDSESISPNEGDNSSSACSCNCSCDNSLAIKTTS